eukprot:g30129.t1
MRNWPVPKAPHHQTKQSTRAPRLFGCSWCHELLGNEVAEAFHHQLHCLVPDGESHWSTAPTPVANLLGHLRCSLCGQHALAAGKVDNHCCDVSWH